MIQRVCMPHGTLCPLESRLENWIFSKRPATPFFRSDTKSPFTNSVCRKRSKLWTSLKTASCLCSRRSRSLAATPLTALRAAMEATHTRRTSTSKRRASRPTKRTHTKVAIHSPLASVNTAKKRWTQMSKSRATLSSAAQRKARRKWPRKSSPPPSASAWTQPRSRRTPAASSGPVVASRLTTVCRLWVSARPVLQNTGLCGTGRVRVGIGVIRVRVIRVRACDWSCVFRAWAQCLSLSIYIYIYIYLACN